MLAQRTDAGQGWEAARTIVRELAAAGVQAELVDRLSARLDDLLKVVRLGAMSSPTIVVIDAAGAVRLRLTHLVPASEIVERVRALTTSA